MSFSIRAHRCRDRAKIGRAPRAATLKRRGIRHLYLFKTRVVTVDGAVALWRTYRTLISSVRLENPRSVRHRFDARAETRNLAARRLLVHDALLRAARQNGSSGL